MKLKSSHQISEFTDNKLQRYIKRYKKKHGSIYDDNPAIIELKKRQGRLI